MASCMRDFAFTSCTGQIPERSKSNAGIVCTSGIKEERGTKTAEVRRVYYSVHAERGAKKVNDCSTTFVYTL